MALTAAGVVALLLLLLLLLVLLQMRKIATMIAAVKCMKFLNRLRMNLTIALTTMHRDDVRYIDHWTRDGIEVMLP